MAADFWIWVGYIASAAGVIGAVASVINYILIKRLEFRREEFARYHAVIRQINVDDKDKDGKPFIEVQMASIYELTLMPRYFDVSLRILKKRKKWLGRISQVADPYLLEEIDRSINTITEKQRWCQ